MDKVGLFVTKLYRAVSPARLDSIAVLRKVMEPCVGIVPNIIMCVCVELRRPRNGLVPNSCRINVEPMLNQRRTRVNLVSP